MMMRHLLLSPLSLTASLATAGEWVSLSNGDSLEGWKKLGGGATYVSKDGVSLGQPAKERTPFSLVVRTVILNWMMFVVTLN